MDWLPVILTVVMALIGAALLFGRDYTKKRSEDGLPPFPAPIIAMLYLLFIATFWSVVVILVLVLLITILS